MRLTQGCQADLDSPLCQRDIGNSALRTRPRFQLELAISFEFASGPLRELAGGSLSTVRPAMYQRLADHDIVLLGAGHTNSHILRMWRMQAIPNARLTCVSNFPFAMYSGMLPGTLAGLYDSAGMRIDLVQFTAAVDARLIVAQVTGLDVARQLLLFNDRPPLPFDVLSVGIGSVPATGGVKRLDGTVIPIKPMQTFLPRLGDRVLDAVHRKKADEPLRVVVVGGGAAGVEIAMALPKRLHSWLDGRPLVMTIAHRGSVVCQDLPLSARTRIARLLTARNIDVWTNTDVHRVEQGQLHTTSGTTLAADLVIWATGAAAPPLLAQFPLPKDEHGFLLTDPTLRSTCGRPIFAVGDTGTIQFPDGRLDASAKAGVYAVRQAPVLWDNLQRIVSGRELRAYHPQRGFLRLLSSADRKAVIAYQGFSGHARWAWWLKDWIDRRFIDKHRFAGPAMRQSPPLADQAPPPMRCAGCGSKVGGDVLASVLEELEIPQHPQVLLGLDTPDDAAVIRPATPGGFAVTADFFTAPLDDSYLVGRIAVLNAASDIFAMGGTPTAAVAIATIPPGAFRKQRQLLLDLLTGSLDELRRMGATLAGGHTIEGPNIMLGFTMLGDPTAGWLTKAGVRDGDALLLTKPLGSGILLAAQMRAALTADSWEPLLATMLRSNEHAARLLTRQPGADCSVSALTDVTGFGLAGHLLEILRASECSAELDLAAIPLLPGVAAQVRAGVESTLAPANRIAEAAIEALPDSSPSRSSGPLRETPAYAALFDPQTSGGLLIAVPESDAMAIRDRLREGGDTMTAIIGFARKSADTDSRIRIIRRDVVSPHRPGPSAQLRG